MPPEKYQINEEKKKQFAGVYLLDVMINTARSFPVLLEGNDQDLEGILEWLLMKGYIEIFNSEKYMPSSKGLGVLKKFMARYSEFLTIFDVYCAVDLENGEFAFERYSSFGDDAEWRSFLANNRWDDLRIAVAEFKKLDPVEIVFMSFLSEGRFGRDETGWQFDLLLGSIWNEILQICNTALKWSELGYSDEQGAVSAEDVIEDIICQGTKLMIRLLKEDRPIGRDNRRQTDQQENMDEDGGQHMEKIEIIQQPVDYYYPYYDPFYVSPVWLGLWLL